MKKIKNIFIFIILLCLSSCTKADLSDCWSHRNDAFPHNNSQESISEEEMLENETKMGIERSDGLKYLLQNDEYYVWGCYEKFEKLTIPDTYKGKPVVGIMWQEGLSFTADELVELYLGKNIRGLSSSSFWRNKLLTKILIDENNEYYEVIDDVLYLTNTNSNIYPCSLIWVLPSKTGELNIKEGVGPFDDGCLKYANNVTKIKIPDSMPDPTLDRNYSFPNFTFCESLEKFIISNNNLNFQVVDGILYSKEGKTIIAYPQGKRGNFAIPEMVRTIYPACFNGAFLNVLLLNSYVQIDKTTFANTRIQSLICDDNNQLYSSYDGCLYSKDMSVFLYSPSEKVTIKINNNTKEINNLVNEQITLLDIPDGVVSIDYLHLPNLQQLILGKELKQIKEKAFSWHKKIDKVFYKGSKNDLQSIVLGDNNPSLVHSTRFFYSEKPPKVSGQYWHYINGKPVVWDK